MGLNELKTHHKEIARLSFVGYKPFEIAEQTGTKLQSVYNALRDPLCKSFIAGLSDKADKEVLTTRQRLASLESPALDAIEDLLDKDSAAPASVILNAAKDVLDRNGYKMPEQVNHAVMHMTMDDIVTLRKRAQMIDSTCINEINA